MKFSLSPSAGFSTRISFVFRQESADIADFDGAKGKVDVRYEGGVTIIYCGLGDASTCTPMVVRAAAAAGIRKGIDLKRAAVSVLCPRDSDQARACMEGVMLGGYSFARYRSEQPHAIGRVQFVGTGVATEAFSLTRSRA